MKVELKAQKEVELRFLSPGDTFSLTCKTETNAWLLIGDVTGDVHFNKRCFNLLTNQVDSLAADAKVIPIPATIILG